jgi:Protein of unknown function (DUF1059)
VPGVRQRPTVLLMASSAGNELMQHVAAHAAIAHPDMELTPETVALVKDLIHLIRTV